MAKVLVIDDSWIARMGMTKLLTGLGHEVWEASDGTLGLAALEARRPDVVFLDLLMPGLDGFGVLQALQGHPTPIWVLTADIQDTTTRRCLDLGARGCLPKPPTREALARCLEGLA